MMTCENGFAHAGPSSSSWENALVHNKKSSENLFCIKKKISVIKKYCYENDNGRAFFPPRCMCRSIARSSFLHFFEFRQLLDRRDIGSAHRTRKVSGRYPVGAGVAHRMPAGDECHLRFVSRYFPHVFPADGTLVICIDVLFRESSGTSHITLAVFYCQRELLLPASVLFFFGLFRLVL